MGGGAQPLFPPSLPQVGGEGAPGREMLPIARRVGGTAGVAGGGVSSLQEGSGRWARRFCAGGPLRRGVSVLLEPLTVGPGRVPPVRKMLKAACRCSPTR